MTRVHAGRRIVSGLHVSKIISSEHRKQKTHNAPWSVTDETEMFSVFA